jgi:preprotein translocase subunit SecF
MVIRNFALAMTIGIVVGTYSSIYVASYVGLLIDNYYHHKKSAQNV